MLNNQPSGNPVSCAILRSVNVTGLLRRRLSVSKYSSDAGILQGFMQFCTLYQEIFLVKRENFHLTGMVLRRMVPPVPCAKAETNFAYPAIALDEDAGIAALFGARGFINELQAPNSH